MKSFRKRNKTYLAFQRSLQRPVPQWLELSDSEQVEICLKFLLLPMLKRQKPITDEIRETMLPSAGDMRAQSLKFLSESPDQFASIHEVLELSARVLLLSESDLKEAQLTESEDTDA